MKFLQRSPLLFAALACGMLWIQACHEVNTDENSRPLTREFDNEVLVDWTDVFLQLDRFAPGYRPGPVPRALGYLGLSAYESVVAGMPENNSLQNQFIGLDIPEADPSLEYYWPACVNESYAYLMSRFFLYMKGSRPDLYDQIEQKRQEMHAKFAEETTEEILQRSEAYGQAVAAAIYEWEKTDTWGHDAFLNPRPIDYTPPSGPGLWQPTTPDFGRAMFPYWGNVRLFALNEVERLSRKPIEYSENPASAFYNQGAEVYIIVKNIHENGPGAFEQKWIAEFWSDDILGWTFSPPARLAAIANQVVENENTDLAGAVELYAKMGLSLSDAGVATWYSKYYYNVERPISYIRRVMSQQYPDAANWTTVLRNPVDGFSGITPAFPAYPSGHSCFGGAGAKILSSFYEFTPTHPGTYTFTDQCHIDRNDFLSIPRTYTSFAELGREDAYSRVPLGVHFRMDCDEGIRIGELAAQRVLELPWKK